MTSPPALLIVTLAGTLAATGPVVRDLDGRLHRPFESSGRVSVLVFTTSDCPISNSYAPEIERVCRAFSARGVDCLLLYEDTALEPSAAGQHRAAFGLGAIPASIDGDRAIAAAAAATVTPEAIVIDGLGVIRYRGRIDNLYAAVGRRRSAASTHELVDAIEAVLAGRAVRQPQTEAFGCFITPPPTRQKELR